jgi:hypothetical protein
MMVPLCMFIACQAVGKRFIATGPNLNGAEQSVRIVMPMTGLLVSGGRIFFAYKAQDGTLFVLPGDESGVEKHKVEGKILDRRVAASAR